MFSGGIKRDQLHEMVKLKKKIKKKQDPFLDFNS